MGYWEDNNNDPSLGGKQIPVVESRTLTGGRALARRRYPYRPGQDVEDMGREPYLISLSCPLFRDVGESHYPEAYEALRAVIDEGGVVDYVDTELGPLRVTIVDFKWEEDANRRDGGVLSLTLEEVSSDSLVLSVLVGDDARSTATLMGAAADDALIATLASEGDILALWSDNGVGLSAFEQELVEGALFEGMADGFFDALDESGQSLDELNEQVTRLERRVDLVLSLPEMVEAEQWTLTYSLTRMLDVARTAATRAAAGVTPDVEYVVPRTMSVWEVSVALYGTEDRWQELLRSNPTADPFGYPAGATLVVKAL